MDERMRRQWAAAEVRAYGCGGMGVVSKVMGISPNTIRKGLAELARREEYPDEPLAERLRGGGGGRKRVSEADPALRGALEQLGDPVTRGDPERPPSWTAEGRTHLTAPL